MSPTKKQPARDSGTSRNTDGAENSTPESERLNEAMSSHDKQDRENVKAEPSPKRKAPKPR